MPEPVDRQLYTEIGRRIAIARRQRSTRLVSQEDLAKGIGLSRTSVVNIERGRHRIQIHVVYAIARVLDVEVSDLLPPARPAADAADLPASFARQLKTEAEKTAVGRLVAQPGGTTRDDKTTHRDSRVRPSR